MTNFFVKSVAVGYLLFVGVKGYSNPSTPIESNRNASAYVTCHGNSIHFEIHGTAVPTLQQGLLVLGDSEIVLTCKRDDSYAPKNTKPRRNETTQWSCREYPNLNGAIMVRVDQITGGRTLASIFQAQIHPLPAQLISKLNCKR